MNQFELELTVAEERELEDALHLSYPEEVEQAFIDNDKEARKLLKRAIDASWCEELFAHRLEINQDQLQKLTKADRVFHFEVGDRSLYPKWQIYEGKLVEGVGQLAHLLSDTLSPLGSVQWSMGKNRLLEDRTPAECLREGFVPQVIATAQSFVAGDYV